MSEYELKLSKLRKVIKERNLDGIFITQQNNFFWLVGGRNYCNITNPVCVCKLLVTCDELYLIGNNVDLPLVFEEEIRDPSLKNLMKVTFAWDESDKENQYFTNLLRQGRYGLDYKMDNAEYLGDDLYKLRTVLMPEELQRYRVLGQETAAVLEEICREIKKGDSEMETAGKLMSKLYPKDIFPVILLVAFDERAYQYRHPLPTAKRLEHHAIVSVCGRRNGLIAAATRMIHFGRLPDDLSQKLDATVKIDAQLISNTRPGQNVCEVLQKGVNAYETSEYGEEWRLHFQGGITGYNTRELKVTLQSTAIVRESQAFCWNPSISGVKSEDTFLVLTDKNEIITETGKYPYKEIEVNGLIIKRPDILIR
jgi:Xaa-Pro dipeptidase